MGTPPSEQRLFNFFGSFDFDPQLITGPNIKRDPDWLTTG